MNTFKVTGRSLDKLFFSLAQTRADSAALTADLGPPLNSSKLQIFHSYFSIKAKFRANQLVWKKTFKVGNPVHLECFSVEGLEANIRFRHAYRKAREKWLSFSICLSSVYSTSKGPLQYGSWQMLMWCSTHLSLLLILPSFGRLECNVVVYIRGQRASQPADMGMLLSENIYGMNLSSIPPVEIDFKCIVSLCICICSTNSTQK